MTVLEAPSDAGGAEIRVSVRFAGMILFVDAVRLLPGWLNARGYESFLACCAQDGILLSTWERSVAWLWGIVDCGALPIQAALILGLILAPRTAKIGFVLVLAVSALSSVLGETGEWMYVKHYFGSDWGWSMSLFTMDVVLPAAMAGWYWLVVGRNEKHSLEFDGKLFHAAPPVSHSLVSVTLGGLTVYSAIFYGAFLDRGLGGLLFGRPVEQGWGRWADYLEGAAEAGLVLALALATVATWVRRRRVLITLWAVFVLFSAWPLGLSVVQSEPLSACLREYCFVPVVTAILIALVYVRTKITRTLEYMVCSECGYFVGAVATTRCPECGTEVGERQREPRDDQPDTPQSPTEGA